MINQGILLLSFGTSYEETEAKTITPIKKTVQKIFPDFEVSVAFTSKIIIKKLEEQGRQVPLPHVAAENMLQQGITHLIVQPLHFMKGHEYENKIVRPLEKLKNKFERFVIGNPLLVDDADFEEIANFIQQMSDSVNNESILLMGHGTDHPEDQVYEQMQQILDSRKINAYIATIEGARSIEDARRLFEKSGTKNVHLFPFLLVAGDHAINDMAGNKKDSWVNILRQSGIDAVPHLRGFGEFTAIRKIFIRHIRACKQQLFPEKYERMRKSAAERSFSIPRKEIPWFPKIHADKCINCGLCYQFCHQDVYGFDDFADVKITVKNPFNCVVNCSHCSRLCGAGAIEFPEKLDLDVYTQ